MKAELIRTNSGYRIKLPATSTIKFPDIPILCQPDMTIKCHLLNMAILHEHKVTFSKELMAHKIAIQQKTRYDGELPEYLFPFQQDSVRQLIGQKGTLLADEQGLGKTIQLIATISKKELYPALIICPAHLKLNWKKECFKFAPFMSTEILSGQGAYDVSADCLIINYEILSYWVSYLRKVVKLIICDEAHRVKNKKAACTKALMGFKRSTPRIMATGTPLVNTPENIWSIVNQINPDILCGYSEFVDYFCIKKKVPVFDRKGKPIKKFGHIIMREEFVGSKNLFLLHKTLSSSIMIRRTKKEVLPQLPEKRDTVLPVETNASIRVESANAVKAILNASNGQQAMGAYAKVYASIGTAKIPAATDWIKDFIEATDEPLVVAGWHREVTETLHSNISKVTKAELVYGGVTDKDKRIQRFLDGESKVLIGNIKTIGTGLTLVNSSTMLFVELPLTAADLNQTKDRIHRIGQVNHCSYYYLIASGTLEERIIQILDEKTKMAGAVVDGTTDSVEMGSLLKDAVKGEE